MKMGRFDRQLAGVAWWLQAHLQAFLMCLQPANQRQPTLCGRLQALQAFARVFLQARDARRVRVCVRELTPITRTINLLVDATWVEARSSGKKSLCGNGFVRLQGDVAGGCLCLQA
jgi:hypothetical protein